MEESIYDLIPPPAVVKSKGKRYVSKYPGNTAPTSSTFGPENPAGHYNLGPWKQGLNLGPKQNAKADPKGFLKKSSLILPEDSKFSYGSRNKAPLPNENGKLARRSGTDFVESNAIKAINGTYTMNARKQEMDYTKKPEYGQVPEYLSTVKAEMRAENDWVRTRMEQERQMYEASQPKMKLMPEDDRCRLLQNLKTKWDAVNQSYQVSTHIVNLDTVGRVRRKEEYEQQLAQLEGSIEKLSKKFVFVQDGDSWE